MLLHCGLLLELRILTEVILRYIRALYVVQWCSVPWNQWFGNYLDSN